MGNISFAAAAFALISVPALSQTISLHAGESVTLRVDNGRTLVERTGMAEPMTKFEAYALWRAETQDIPPGARTMPPSFILKGEGPPDPPQPAANRITLTMRKVPGLEPGSAEKTALFLQNGYDSDFGYRAVLNRNGRSEPTDVCDVPAHFPGLEYWPYSVDEIEISKLHLDPADGQMQCG
jgi:hypothetical protein